MTDHVKSTSSVAPQEARVRPATSPSPASELSSGVPIISVEHVSLDYKKEKEPLPVLVIREAFDHRLGKEQRERGPVLS